MRCAPCAVRLPLWSSQVKDVCFSRRRTPVQIRQGVRGACQEQVLAGGGFSWRSLPGYDRAGVTPQPNTGQAGRLWPGRNH